MASELITAADFQDFKDLMYSAHKTFNKKVLLWFRQASSLDRWGEDSPNGFIPVVLLVLVNYNYMRNWPATLPVESGKDDRESMQVLINKQYLKESGYLTPQGYFDFKPDNDMFAMDGVIYRSYGDTMASQSGSDDILMTLILRREKLNTEDQRGIALLKLASEIAGTLLTDPDGEILLGNDGQPLRA
jgi:hypothetical protein